MQSVEYIGNEARRAFASANVKSEVTERIVGTEADFDIDTGCLETHQCRVGYVSEWRDCADGLKNPRPRTDGLGREIVGNVGNRSRPLRNVLRENVPAHRGPV